MYRKDLLEQKGLKLPDQPTFEDIAKFAAALNDKEHGFYGLALRGQPGWGENMASVDTMANSLGATWFYMDWHPTLDRAAWKNALSFYAELMKKYDPSGGAAKWVNES